MIQADVPLDTFTRPELSRRAFGLDPARARIELRRRTAEEPIVLLLGDFVPTGGGVYAALRSDPRIFQIGAVVVSEISKAFYLTLPEKSAAGPTPSS